MTSNAPNTPRNPLKIVSGGQTGADRAALDAALQLGIPCGGWCPSGRRAEDGPIPEIYPLKEMTSPRYDVRTRENVADSDGTLILTDCDRSAGTLLTIRTAQRLNKPLLFLDFRQLLITDRQEQLSEWIEINSISKLNVAGPRESTSPGIFSQAKSFLQQALKPYSGSALRTK
ncbi:putative molybdenum carrier [Thalassoglobus neptunius]|uniref:Putative molybdenum carrier n=1 Tax=Thalassoglobus neptunius TaxID=1938619 RepID=A0A5C5X1T3_9PLAN|nr:putative molybdenum carrier protein [Thalassoglobus neptunius]TWT57094.1 putative molybdenum carrier [Thalassoglobus neptunius]